jgi:hypothetical protein
LTLFFSDSRNKKVCPDRIDGRRCLSRPRGADGVWEKRDFSDA